MAQALVQENLLVLPADGDVVTNTVVATTLLGSLQPVYQMKLAPGYFRPGRSIRITASGRISTLVTSPGTLTLDVKLGAVVVATSGAMVLNVLAKVNVPWALQWMLQCRASGAVTNFFHQGFWASEAIVGAPLPAAGGVPVHMLPNAAPAVGSNVDGTTELALDLFVTWSVANAANSIRLHQFVAEMLP